MAASQWGTARRLATVAVHTYTALGAVLALLMVHLAYAGDVRAVLWLFLAAMVIDGTDGLLARRVRVAEVAPRFDGALLDNIVDYLTYVFAPVVLLWTAGYLPDGRLGAVVAAVPLLASCYQFCRTDAKTADHLFLGFPSYWNVVAFYLVVLDASVAVSTSVLLVLAALVFAPVGYVYPSRTALAWRLTMVLTAVWMILYATVVARYPTPSPWLVALSGAYLVYYAGLSLHLTWRRRRSVTGRVDDVDPESRDDVEGGCRVEPQAGRP